MSNLFVCAMGVGTVFVGLICLVILTMILSLVCKIFAKPKSDDNSINAAAPALQKSSDSENKQEIIAASCAVIAEELGTDVKNIKVTSFKKL